MTVLSNWLKCFISHLRLTLQGLVVHIDKNDCLIWDGSFLRNKFAAYINDFISITGKIRLYYGSVLGRYLT